MPGSQLSGALTTCVRSKTCVLLSDPTCSQQEALEHYEFGCSGSTHRTKCPHLVKHGHLPAGDAMQQAFILNAQTNDAQNQSATCRNEPQIGRRPRQPRRRQRRQPLRFCLPSAAALLLLSPRPAGCRPWQPRRGRGNEHRAPGELLERFPEFRMALAACGTAKSKSWWSLLPLVMTTDTILACAESRTQRDQFFPGRGCIAGGYV